MESFTSLNNYLKHEMIAHELPAPDGPTRGAVKEWGEKSVLCVFGGEPTKAGKGDNARGRHIDATWKKLHLP